MNPHMKTVKQLHLGSPYRSADGRAMYANTPDGTRYRVEFDGPNLVRVPRFSKRAKKAAKKMRRELVR
jgi:hypothetical protein